MAARMTMRNLVQWRYAIDGLRGGVGRGEHIGSILVLGYEVFSAVGV